MRRAEPADVPAICEFGAAHIPDHYTPLIGKAAAHAQVSNWWNPARIGAAVSAGGVVVAESPKLLLGVGERGERNGEPVIWKLYVHPDHRSRGLGARLLDALIAGTPEESERLLVEHFAVNERAATFYQREGFVYLGTESHPSDPAMSVVWRALDLAARRGERV